MHSYWATVPGFEGQFNVICFDSEVSSSIRGQIIGVDDPGIWSEFKKYKVVYTITNLFSVEFWFYPENEHDFAAIKDGINQLVNETLEIIKNRGGILSVVDLRNLVSERDNIELKVGFEKWMLTHFWKRWLALFYSLPIAALITLTTNDLIKFRKDVKK